MIKGIGTDIAEIERVRRLLDTGQGDRFIARVLTGSEQAILIGKKARVTEFVTGRFAAKEAVAKALGCGIGEKLGFHDIEIVPDAAGKPLCRITERSQGLLSINQEDCIHVTISHTEVYAVAFAVWESI